MSGGVPHSNENPSRRATRLALGVAMGFVFSQLAAWPMAHLLPVAVVPLLLDARPVSYSEGWRIFRTCLFNFFLGGVIAWLLSPWPAVLGIVCAFMLYRFSTYLLSSGAHLLALISALVGFVVVPIIVVLLPPVGFIAAIGFSLDWGFAMIIAWITWLIMPRNAPLPNDHEPEQLAPELTRELAWTLTMVLTPLMVGFMVFSYPKILVGVYAVLIASTFSSAGGRQEAANFVVANGVYGALGMAVAYELLVMVPEVTFLFPLMFAAVYIFCIRMFKGGPTAGYWQSGLFGFLIMLGGILMKDDIVAASTLVERLWQLLLAAAYVTFSYQVLELFRYWKSRRKDKRTRSTDQAA
jgi:hypothetical protein